MLKIIWPFIFSVHGEHWNISVLGSCSFDKIIKIHQAFLINWCFLEQLSLSLEASLIFIHFSQNLPARQGCFWLCYLRLFSLCSPVTLKSSIWGLLPECPAFSWSCWFLGFSTSPQPFWILICPWILLTSVRHRWLVCLFVCFFSAAVLTFPSHTGDDTARPV